MPSDLQAATGVDLGEESTRKRARNQAPDETLYPVALDKSA